MFNSGQLFVPFGPEAGDTVETLSTGGSSDRILLSTPFPFFGELRPEIWASTLDLIDLFAQFTNLARLQGGRGNGATAPPNRKTFGTF